MATILEKSNSILADKNANLLPENLKSGVTCLGVEGTLVELIGEEKNIVPTTEEQTIVPSDGFNGITNINVSAVNATIDANITAENIKKDVTILGVTGILEQSTGETTGAKIFESIEEMQADTTAEEGDLALVYRTEIQNAKVNSKFSSAIFPTTVVLPKALTDYVSIGYVATDNSVMFDCYGQLDSSYFRMDCYSETGEAYVQYESSDGITYIRTDGGDEAIDFGTEICYYDETGWDDTIGYFIQCEGKFFEGLYQYVSITDTTRIDMMQNIRRDDSNKLVYDAVPIEVDMLSTIIQAARTSISTNVTDYALSSATYHNALIEKLSDTEYNVYFRAYLSSSKIALSYCGLFEQDGAYYLADYPNGWFDTTVGTLANSTESTKPRVYAMLKINVNLDTGVSTYTELPASDFTQTSIAGYKHAKYNQAFDTNSILVVVRYMVVSRTTTNDSSIYVTTSSSNGEYISTKYATMYIYDTAPTQLDATSGYVYAKTFYGKNGVKSGTLQDTENLDIENVVSRATLYNIYKNNKIATPTAMNWAFGKKDYVHLDLTFLDTSNTTDMGAMFSYCTSLKTLDLSGFDTSNTTSMGYMFEGCVSLELLDLSTFDFTNVTAYYYMFEEVPANCLIYVKDQTAKDWVLARRSDFTNVQIKS